MAFRDAKAKSPCLQRLPVFQSKRVPAVEMSLEVCGASIGGTERVVGSPGGCALLYGSTHSRLRIANPLQADFGLHNSWFALGSAAVQAETNTNALE